MSGDLDRIIDASRAVKTFEAMCDLIRDAEKLLESGGKKVKLLQSLAHDAFMLASVQTTDWAKLQELFTLHRRLGFTRINARLSTEICYAECALDFANEADCRAAIDNLSESLSELHESLSPAEQQQLLKTIERFNVQLSNRGPWPKQ